MRKSRKGKNQAGQSKYEKLEPRKLLAADFGVGLGSLSAQAGLPDYSPDRLVHSLANPIAVEDRMDLLSDYFQLNENEGFERIQFQRDHLGFGHVKYQQLHNGIAVEGGTVTVHAKNRQVISVSGSYFDFTGDTFASAKLGEHAAFEFALGDINADHYVWQDSSDHGEIELHDHDHDHDHDHHGHLVYEGEEFGIPEGELVYFDAGDGDPRLAYKFDIFAIEPLSRDYVFVDAHTGAVLAKYDRIHTADTPADGTSLYNGTVNFVADDTGSLIRLRQQVNGVETFDLNNGTDYNAATDITSPTTSFTAPDVHTGVQAHFGAEQTLDYFFTNHGRDSYDDNGTTLYSYVSYSTNYVNAFWNGSAMTYGDGNGTTYGPLVSLDIVGHEIAHGVTQYSAGLIYSYESGALNESFSDIFGEAVENWAIGTNDWLMGDDIGINRSGALRNMANPNDYNDPDTYLGDFWYTGTGDNGGVHINSGVQNKWFYIMVEGEAGTNDHGYSYDVTGIGMSDAAEIAYRNLSVYLDQSSNYAEAREGAVQSAIDLFGYNSQQHISTMEAWDAVGVYEPVINLNFRPIQTAGSLVYHDNQSGQIFGPGDVESISLNVDPGQTATIQVTGTGGLIPNIEILAPNGDSVDSVTGTGSTTLLQTASLNSGGEYTVIVAGEADTTGDFDIELILNASMELEAVDGTANDSLATAQDIDASAYSLGTLGAERLAVMGSLESSSEVVASEGFESGSLGAEWQTTSSAGNGRILVTNQIGSADGSYALLMDVSSSGAYSLNEAVWTVDLANRDSATLSFYQAEWTDETHSLPLTFTGSAFGDGVAISEDGINWYTILTDIATPSGEFVYFEFDLVAEAAAVGMNFDSDFHIKFQQYDNFSYSSDGRAFDAIEIISGGQTAEDWYSFELGPDQDASLLVEKHTGDLASPIELEIFDADENLLATGSYLDGVASIPEFTNPESAIADYYVRVTGDQAEYALVVGKDTRLDIEPNDETNPVDLTDVQGYLGHVVGNPVWDADPDLFGEGDILNSAFADVTLSNEVTGGNVVAAVSSFTAPTGTKVFAPSVSEASGWREGDNELRADFAELQSTVTIDVGSDDSSDVGYLRAYDASGNLLEEVVSGSIANGQSETLTISRGSADIAYVIAAGVGNDITPMDNLTYENFSLEEDFFTFEVTAPIELNFTGFLPGQGPNHFDNGLDIPGGSDLRMELKDPSGTVITVDSTQISHIATDLGTYELKVYGETSSGEYFLESIPRAIVPDAVDFGTIDSPVEPGFERVGTEAYTPTTGYGWTSSLGLNVFEQTRGNSLARDKVVMRNGTFVMDVANGTYDVTVFFGSVRRSAPVSVGIEGSTDIFNLNRGPNVNKTYTVTVTDGQMTFDFDGSVALDRRIRIAGISMQETQSLFLAASNWDWNAAQFFSMKSEELTSTVPEQVQGRELPEVRNLESKNNLTGSASRFDKAEFRMDAFAEAVAIGDASEAFLIDEVDLASL